MRLLFFFILLCSLVVAEQSLTYFYEDMESNPDKYTIVIPASLSKEESMQVVELAQAFGLKKSKLDSETKPEEENLIIIGNAEKNEVTRKLSPELPYKNGMAIRLVDDNLIIAGESTEDLVNAIKQATLKKDIEMNSPNGNLLLIIGQIVAVISVIGIVTLLCWKSTSLPHPAEQKEAKIDADFLQLKQYAWQNLKRGYTKTQISQVLINQGWPQNTVEQAFKELGRQ